jgi:flagellar biosynthesis/type III secretory pathway chaperone
MTDDKKLFFQLKLSELTNIWKTYCEFHSDLYDLTCDEYVHLLASDMDKLEDTVELKNSLINTINIVEEKRTAALEELNSSSKDYNFSKLNEIIIYAKKNNFEEGSYLEKYNLLLVDIISKIQDQNKMNQLFLNKAILSLRNLKESFSGRKTFKTYGANGTTRTKSVTP